MPAHLDSQVLVVNDELVEHRQQGGAHRVHAELIPRVCDASELGGDRRFAERCQEEERLEEVTEAARRSAVQLDLSAMEHTRLEADLCA